MNIRHSSDSEQTLIHQLHLNSFGEEEGQAVADLVLALFADETAQPLLSLVAEQDNQIIGHVLFTPVRFVGVDQPDGYILAPLAVSTEHQRTGIGQRLIKAGLEILKAQGASFVLVLGDPAYYCRAGFHTNHNIQPPHQLPYPEAWMAQALQTGALEQVKGTVRCADALNAPEYW